MSPDNTPRVWLIHWKSEEAAPRLARLEEAGLDAVFDDLTGGAPEWRQVREEPPDVFVIDLSRLPSHGREAGAYIRNTKALRQVPIVFVDGVPEKADRVRTEFPDAVFTDWYDIKDAVRRAIEEAPATFQRPKEHMERYAGRPLHKKLGIKEGHTVVLVRPPDGVERILGDLPGGTRLRKRNQGKRDLTLWFTRSLKELEGDVQKVAGTLGGSPLWIAWPKKSSPLSSDHTELDVRRVGLAAGLVDYKICAIDQDWSGLLFKVRD